MNVDISYYTSPGGRTVNEDTVSVLESGSSVLALVADGLGGHRGGDAASRCAAATINGQLQNCPVGESSLVGAIGEANRKIQAMQKDRRTMKTTIAALWVGGGTAVAANVGDSRIYQIRDNKILYQSVDHSVSQMAVYVGEIRPDQIRGHQDRNKLLRALGADDVVRVDSRILNVRDGDCFLLCSDGFWENITEEQMLHELRQARAATPWLQQMRSFVETRGRHNMDNHSAIVLRFYGRGKEDVL